MRNASAALVALLASSRSFLVADLLTIARVDESGVALPAIRLTNASDDVVVAGNVFSAAGPTFTRATTKLVTGLAVATMDVTLYPDAAARLGGLAWPAAVAAGALDGARVTLERLVCLDWRDTSAGTLVLFVGRVGEADATAEAIRIPVHADVELLAQPMPRNLYQPGCLHTLYDAGCGLSRASFSAALSALAGSTSGVVLASTAAAAGLYALGTLTFTSGANAGVARSVRAYAGGAFTLTAALPAAPAAGDTFVVAQGCDKTLATCGATFANAARFRGYPFIPRNEQAQ